MYNFTDASFIDAIVHEVKSQGHFDQFRKECLADVDTKPAYQNLRQRVESSVNKFLSQQHWTDNIRYKNQLREKLRKDIIDSGFLETGVERIVDQVVNPKIATVFHPKVEEIVYNYLGIEKPQPVLNGSSVEIHPDFLLQDLEAVSPDSDKKSSSASSDLQSAIEHNTQEQLHESKENVDDFESPAFEPLETRPPSQSKHESNDSHGSSISGLTSQESIESEHTSCVQQYIKTDKGIKAYKNLSEQDVEISNTEEENVQGENISPDTVQNDSHLSQVSSNSHLSIMTSSEGAVQNQHTSITNPRLDITEEAQMPSFNENSFEEEGELSNTSEEQKTESVIRGQTRSNFDLNKESYEFKCTERITSFLTAEAEKPIYALMQTKKPKSKEREDSYSAKPYDHDKNPKKSSTFVAEKCEENSSHSERSLRICEDSTMEQKDFDRSSHFDNCDSIKTPLNDEHSTESAPDVEKMDNSQVEVVSLAAVQQHSVNEKNIDQYQQREQDLECDLKQSLTLYRLNSSSTRDKRSHNSSKNKKKYQRDQKNDNVSSNSNSESSKKTNDKKKIEDDHYSSHEKPTRKRRSTDRDSNDGNECTARPSNDTRLTLSYAKTNTGTLGDTRKTGGNQANLNESLESSFEGFDEEQLSSDPKSVRKKDDILSKTIMSTTKNKSKNCKHGDFSKIQRKIKSTSNNLVKEADRKNTAVNMEVFAFSFDKPCKLGTTDETTSSAVISVKETIEEVTIKFNEPVLHEKCPVIEKCDSVDHIEEGVIVLEPTEIERVVHANEEIKIKEVISCPKDKVLQSEDHRFYVSSPSELIVLTTQPVVVDQMLTNVDNMDLELLIGEQQLHGDETTMNKIEHGLDVGKNKIKKPKIASNFCEAKKFMKIRKQIERKEKKKRDQAISLAKKMINKNGIISENNQGVELEFVCDKNSISPKPTISSRVLKKNKTCILNDNDLLFFPEENEIFPHIEDLHAHLKLKTEGTSYSKDYSVQYLNIKLYPLGPSHTESTGTDTPKIEKCIERKDSLKQCSPRDVLEVRLENELDARQQRAWSIDESNANLDQYSYQSSQDIESTKGILLSTSSKHPENYNKSSKSIKNSSNQVKYLAEKGPDPRLEKTRFQRLHRSNEKITKKVIHNTSATILAVEISEIKNQSTAKSPTPSNSNNGVIKAQRYSSDDLYKPRPLNGLRTRTRPRTCEMSRTETAM